MKKLFSLKIILITLVAAIVGGGVSIVVARGQPGEPLVQGDVDASVLEAVDIDGLDPGFTIVEIHPVLRPELAPGREHYEVIYEAETYEEVEGVWELVSKKHQFSFIVDPDEDLGDVLAQKFTEKTKTERDKIRAVRTSLAAIHGNRYESLVGRTFNTLSEWFDGYERIVKRVIPQRKPSDDTRSQEDSLPASTQSPNTPSVSSPSGNGGQQTSQTELSDASNQPPVITDVAASPTEIVAGDLAKIRVFAEDPDTPQLFYKWSDSIGGEFESNTDLVFYTRTDITEITDVKVIVTVSDGLTTVGTSVDITIFPDDKSLLLGTEPEPEEDGSSEEEGAGDVGQDAETGQDGTGSVPDGAEEGGADQTDNQNNTDTSSGDAENPESDPLPDPAASEEPTSDPAAEDSNSNQDTVEIDLRNNEQTFTENVVPPQEASNNGTDENNTDADLSINQPSDTSGNTENGGVSSGEEVSNDSSVPEESGVFEVIRPITGCTDDTASNFNPDATIDDGSCIAGEFVELDPPSPPAEIVVEA